MYTHLTLEQRYHLRLLFDQDKSMLEIARILECHRSTIYRELNRNSTNHCGYSALQAQKKYLERKRYRYLKIRKIRGKVEKIVVEKLCAGWSPLQISGRLSLEGFDPVSHETIYRFILRDKIAGGLLYRSLRLHKKRRGRYGRGLRINCNISGRIPISQRPLHVAQRQQLGHWERDLIVGKDHDSAILVLQEMKSRFVRIKKMESFSPRHTYKLMKLMYKKADPKLKSITNDNGLEFADHKKLTKRYGVPVYFTDPYSAWQRGGIENANGLIRQFFPKRTDFQQIDAKYILAAQNSLNLRPRRCLKYKTPQEVFNNEKYRLIDEKIQFINVAL